MSIIKNITDKLIEKDQDWIYFQKQTECSIMRENIGLVNINYYLQHLLSCSITDLYSATENLKFTNLTPVLESENSIIAVYDGRILNVGLADKIRGILELYSISKTLHYKFYIHFIYPFELSKYLKPRLINWHINPNNIVYDNKISSTLFYSVKTGNIEHLNNIREKLIDFIDKNPRQQYQITTNLHSYQCENYNILFHELFKPSPLLQSELNKHSILFNENYISVSFRFMGLLGDFPEGHSLNDEEQSNLMNKCLKEINLYFDDLPSNYKIFVASDSNKFINYVKDQPRIYAISSHRGHSRSGNVSEDAILQTFVDFFLIMGAKKIYRFVARNSGMYTTLFPWLASKIARKKFIEHEFDI